MRAALLALLAAALAAPLAGHAQTAAAPAYPGCRLAWDYPAASAARVARFEVFVGAKNTSTLPPEAREIPCADLNLSIGTQTVKVRAIAKDDGAQSPFATLSVDYRNPAPMPAPSSVKIIMEWTLP